MGEGIQIQLSDEVLMSRFQQGDETYFRALFERYSARLVNFAYKFLRSREEAEEIAQETLLRVYREKRSFDPSRAFRPWLYSIALRLAYNKLRYLKRHPKESLDAVSLSGDESAADRIADHSQLRPDQILEKQAEREKVWSALVSLPESQRSAIILSRFEELSYEEIASVLDVSVSSVKSLIFRAKESLINCLRATLNK